MQSNLGIFVEFLMLAAPVGILGAIRRSLWTYGLMKMRFLKWESECDGKMRESYPQIWDLIEEKKVVEHYL
jgi:hypothetical protein